MQSHCRTYPKIVMPTNNLAFSESIAMPTTVVPSLQADLDMRQSVPTQLQCYPAPRETVSSSMARAQQFSGSRRLLVKQRPLDHTNKQNGRSNAPDLTVQSRSDSPDQVDPRAFRQSRQELLARNYTGSPIPR
jgi:hypothetical protein